MGTRREFLQLAATCVASGLLSRNALAAPSTGTLSASMWIYQWDLIDEGFDLVLPRLHDNGLTSISLATAYHGGKFLEPHNPKHRVAFLEDGAVMFQPTPSLYGDVVPIVHSLVGAGHDLGETRRETERRGMQLHSWVVCCHNTPLGMAHPALVSRTVFGDPLYHNLCPSNNDLRRYLRALITDVASHGVDQIELEALQFQGYAHGFHHEREGITLTPLTKFLLGLCFCSSCVKRAHESHLDLRPMQEYTRTTLERCFADPEGTFEQFSSLDVVPGEILEPYLQWRVGVVQSLLLELQEASGRVPLRQMMSVDAVSRRLVSVDPSASAQITGGILALGYVKDGAALRAPLAELQTLLGDRTLTLGFQVGLPESGGKPEFLDRMRVARTLGISRFNFYNYGFIPLRNLGWIAQSLT
jgi:hypothetical protein